VRENWDLGNFGICPDLKTWINLGDKEGRETGRKGESRRE